MFRLGIRLFLLAYFLMPVVAIILVIQTFLQIRSDVSPIFEAANIAISNAVSALETEARNLGNNFAPLADAVNATRNALQAVLNFLRNTVYTLIDVVNSLNLACSVGGTACIPKSINVTLPTLIDLSFINNISDNISGITSQVNNVITTTTTSINNYASMLMLAVLVFFIWTFLSFILFGVSLYTGLWKRA